MIRGKQKQKNPHPTQSNPFVWSPKLVLKQVDFTFDCLTNRYSLFYPLNRHKFCSRIYKKALILIASRPLFFVCNY